MVAVQFCSSCRAAMVEELNAADNVLVHLLKGHGCDADHVDRILST